MVSNETNQLIILSSLLLAANFGLSLASNFTHKSFVEDVTNCIVNDNKELDKPLDLKNLTELSEAVSNFDFDNFFGYHEIREEVENCFFEYCEKNQYHDSNALNMYINDCTCNGIASLYKNDNVILNCDEITQLLIDGNFKEVGLKYQSALANATLSHDIFEVPIQCAFGVERILCADNTTDCPWTKKDLQKRSALEKAVADEGTGKTEGLDVGRGLLGVHTAHS